jgi:hypothetical protein
MFALSFRDGVAVLDVIVVPCRYRLIVKYKTAFYSFYLPVAAALVLASVSSVTRSFP